MAKITFKAKPQKVWNHDNTLAYEYISVPEFKRHHCDMSAFRMHQKFGPYANSDLFPGMLKGIRNTLFPKGMIKLHEIPEGVSVDTTGFLASVTFDV